MKINFYKYQAAGNDFILLDQITSTSEKINLSQVQIQKICHRNFGIGADGLIILNDWDNDKKILKIDLYNSDGGVTAMCANGTRCAIALAKKILNLKDSQIIISTLSGQYIGKIEGDTYWLSIDKSAVKTFEYNASQLKTNFEYLSFYFADSGVPHSIFFVNELSHLDLPQIAPPVRHHEMFSHGCNVNFVKKNNNDNYDVRTFERGVEGETLSCGTGILAISYILSTKQHISGEIVFNTPGGILKAQIHDHEISYGGLVKLVFSGTYAS